MTAFTVYIIIIVAIALLFDFSNGMNDAANSIATVVATRVLSLRLAVLWAAFFNFIAAFLFETGVAKTIGSGLVAENIVNPHLILATLIAAIAWTLFCTRNGLPISVSHALIGALAGAALVEGGIHALIWGKLQIVAAFIILSPLIGLAAAGTLTVLLTWISWNKPPRKVDRVFRTLQLVSAGVYSLSHGLNDAQKTMGIILALLLSVPELRGYATCDGTAQGHLRWWIILSCHAAIALGTYAGGWKVIRTLGHRVTRLQPFDGFAAETGGGVTIIALSLLKIPVSTTHTITGAIFGVGIVRRLANIRWSVGADIATAWVLTLPASALVSALVYAFMRYLILGLTTS